MGPPAMQDRMAGVRSHNPAHGVDGPPSRCNPHSRNTSPAAKRRPRHPELVICHRDTVLGPIPTARKQAATTGPTASHPDSPAQCRTATHPIRRVSCSAAKRTTCRAKERVRSAALHGTLQRPSQNVPGAEWHPRLPRLRDRPRTLCNSSNGPASLDVLRNDQ